MAVIVTETYYVKVNGKYDKETKILEEDYPIDDEIANTEADRVNLSNRSAEQAAKKADLLAKKAAAIPK